MATAAAQKPFADVGKQEPMTILIPSTPWLPAFTKMVELYEQQTGNKIKLDVNPFGGVLDKARNDVRSSAGTYDVVMLDTQWTIEFYEGGFLTPLADIEPGFDTPKEVLRYGDSGYWNEKKRWRTANGGKLMAFTPLGNIPVAVGSHEIVWRHPQIGERRRTVNVGARTPVRLSMDMTK